MAEITTDKESFDTSRAVKTAIDPVTGETIYFQEVLETLSEAAKEFDENEIDDVDELLELEAKAASDYVDDDKDDLD